MTSDYEKIQLLESVLGKGQKANRDYYQFTCPFHVGRNGPKLGVSLGTGKWGCWVCPAKGSTVNGLFRKLGTDEQKVRLSKDLFQEKVHFQREKISLSLPKEFIPLTEPSTSFFHVKSKNYLLSRGVTELDICKHNIGYCTSGKYSDMVIMPSYNENGQLIFFTARSILNEPKRRFDAPANVDKNVVFDENLINWNEPLVIVESKLDAIIVRRNAYPLNGKVLTDKLKEKILNSNVKEIYSALDGDALNDVMRHAKYFINHGIDVYKVNIPEDEDPTSLGHEKIWELINQAEKVTESMIFKYELLNKLKK